MAGSSTNLPSGQLVERSWSNRTNPVPHPPSKPLQQEIRPVIDRNSLPRNHIRDDHNLPYATQQGHNTRTQHNNATQQRNSRDATQTTHHQGRFTKTTLRNQNASPREPNEREPNERGTRQRRNLQKDTLTKGTHKATPIHTITREGPIPGLSQMPVP